MNIRQLELIAAQAADHYARAFRRYQAAPDCAETREIYLMALRDYASAQELLLTPEERCPCRGCSSNGLVDF